MVYVYANIREIKTMRLKNMRVISELDREIYAVRFLGILKDFSHEKQKIVLKISDGEDLECVMYPKISIGVDELGKTIKRGDRVIVFAHLEPMSKTCYVDILKKANRKDQLKFLKGLITTYLRLVIKEETKKCFRNT